MPCRQSRHEGGNSCVGEPIAGHLSVHFCLAHRVPGQGHSWRVLQRLVYNSPANLFVAGFIGLPPMKFLDDALVDGRFSASAGGFPTPSRASHRAAVAGVRPEDCRVTEASGKIAGEVYTTELMGDHTLVTCRVGGTTMIVEAEKTFNRRNGEAIGVDFTDVAVHLFDKACDKRIG